MASKKFPYTIVKSQDFHKLKNEMNVLVEQIASARNFIKEIESGNLAIEFNGNLIDKDRENGLAESLISMRDQMRTIAEEEKQRNWITEGLAKFIDILRSNNDDLKSLGEIIISNVIKYIKGNQGSLYIINDSDPANVYLEMIACYAYDRKKHGVKNIGMGEGLVGQCVLEKSPIYMTNLPSDYIKITSGLGSALPKNLLIVPLIVNEKVYGVIEMASFNVFEQHQRDFIEKLAESIASTVANVRINEQTKKLLGETQTQAEQMRSQEEEMRQSMEELTATQEEMQRVNQDVGKKEKYLHELLNVSTDSIFTIDKEYKLSSWNKSFAKTLEQFGMRLERGMNTMDWYPTAEEKENQLELYRRVFKGESFDFTASSEQNGKKLYHLSIYAPLRTQDGEVYEAAVFAKDVTAMMTAQNELQAQEEELRQNMEELTTTQEEMQRILRDVEKKEKYLNELLNVSTDSIFTIDKEFKLVSWNRSFAKTLEQFGMILQKGMNTMDWYPGDEERTKQVALYNRAFNGESFDFTALSEQNGKTMYHLSIYAPLRTDSGEVYEAAIFAKDVTIMMTAQKELQAQEEELRQNMEELKTTQEEMAKTEILMAGQLSAINNSMATIEFSMEGIVLAANDKFCQATGYSIEEIKGKHHRLFLNKEYAKSSEYVKFWKDLNAGIAQTGEFNRVGKQGKEIWISASYTVVKDSYGKAVKVIKFAMDITKQKLKSVDYEGQIDAIRRSNAVIEFDIMGNILYANDLFLNAMGYDKPSDVLNLHHSIFVSEFEVKSADYKKFWERLERGEFFTGEFQRKKANGQSIWIYGSYNPILDAEGKPYKVVKYAQVVNKNAQAVSGKAGVPAR
jgi:PAS domain S-box-containing protein